MRKKGAVGALAVALKVLCDDGRHRHGDADEAVVIDADPDNVEPRQAVARGPPGATLAAAALSEPADGPNPGLDGCHFAEVVLLIVEVGGDVVAHEREEGRDGKGLVAVGQNLEVDGVPVEAQREPRRRGIYGYHEEDADDAGPRRSAEDYRGWGGLRHTASARWGPCSASHAS